MDYINMQDMVEFYQIKAGQVNPDPELYFNLIGEEFNELLEAEVGTENELKELCDLLYVIFGYGVAMGYNLNDAFTRVHSNNLTRMVHDDGEIHRNSKGKIIKNPNTPKVDLSDLV